MSVDLVSASSQRIRNAAPPLVSTGYPFTVAMWVRPTTSGTKRSFWSFGDTAVANNYFSLGQTAANAYFIEVSTAAGAANSTAGGSNLNVWTFIVARFISATSRRLTSLATGGLSNIPTHAQNTASRAPTSLDAMSIGCREINAAAEFFDGQVAELWYTDIQPDGAQLDAGLARQLAFGGPFSLQHVAKDVLEYRSLRKHPTAGDGRDIIVGAGAGMQAWENVNGVGLGPHPPLPYWFANPRQTRRPFPI